MEPYNPKVQNRQWLTAEKAEDLKFLSRWLAQEHQGDPNVPKFMLLAAILLGLALAYQGKDPRDANGKESRP